MPFSRRPSVSASVCQGLGARASRAHTSPDAFSQTDLAFTVMCLPSCVVVVVSLSMPIVTGTRARCMYLQKHVRPDVEETLLLVVVHSSVLVVL